MHEKPRSKPSDAPRILEIGDRTLLAREFPASTTLAWSGPDHALPAAVSCVPLDRGADAACARALRAGEYDAVVWHAPEREPWRERRWGLANPRLWRAWRLARATRSLADVPLIAVDMRDRAEWTRSATAMLTRADAYFLREFPERGPVPPRGSAAGLEAKLEPVSIGLARERVASMRTAPVEKTSDVFFAGQVDTPLRRAEWPALLALRRDGVRVDMSETRLPPAEFYRRCASAWIVWSPEGRGWQCFRHLEAAACGSVPLMNRPAIRQHEPLVDGVHGLHYDARPGSLARAVVEALADKARLTRIAAAARDHVLTHHTHAAICARILSAIYASRPK